MIRVSKSTVLAMVALLVVSSMASPTSLQARNEPIIPSRQFHQLQKDLYRDGKLDWVEVEGGHITSIPNSMGKSYLTQRGINPDGTMSPTEIVDIQDDWHDAGTVHGKEYNMDCFGSGPKVLTRILQSPAIEICKAFFEKSAAGVAINNGWNAFVESGLAEQAGKSFELFYRWYVALHKSTILHFLTRATGVIQVSLPNSGQPRRFVRNFLA